MPGLLVEVFATPAATERYAELARAAQESGAAWTPVEERALASLSDAVSPAGLVGVCRFLDTDLASVLATGPRLVAVCADVRDPGKRRHRDPLRRRRRRRRGRAGRQLGRRLQPKTVRASVGSLFHLPVVVAPDAAAAVRELQGAGLAVLAADGAGERDLYGTAPLEGPVAWLFGNEAWGLPDELAALADHRVSIPIHGRAESLNLSTAAALCLYETARTQRRT